jgi:hypothetical protein
MVGAKQRSEKRAIFIRQTAYKYHSTNVSVLQYKFPILGRHQK